MDSLIINPKHEISMRIARILHANGPLTSIQIRQHTKSDLRNDNVRKSLTRLIEKGVLTLTGAHIDITYAQRKHMDDIECSHNEHSPQNIAPSREVIRRGSFDGGKFYGNVRARLDRELHAIPVVGNNIEYRMIEE
jgi:hypothetical protein